MSGWLYWHPFIYNVTLSILYGGKARAKERFSRIANEVEESDVVVDLCAGNSYLLDALENKIIDYQAYDVNDRFVKALKRRGASAYCCDVRKINVPEADVIVMASALYHFHPNCAQILERMLASARKKVILVEPVKNAVNSSNCILSAFARKAGQIGNDEIAYRFDLDDLVQLLESLKVPNHSELISGGRDMLVVFDLQEV